MMYTPTKKQKEERKRELIKFCKDERNSYLMSNHMLTIKEIRSTTLSIVEDVCHSLGKPDWNGENHICNVDGMHWKELSEKFEKEINSKTK